MPKRYRRLRGSSAYYPFAARTDLRARQRRRARRLWLAGIAVLILAALLLARQTIFNGGQPSAPSTAAQQTAETAKGGSVSVSPRAATADALAATQTADADAHTAPETTATPAPQTVAEILPQYRDLYAQNSDLVGWLRIEGAGVDLPVVQTVDDNEYYLRRGFDRLYATGGTLFVDARCSVAPEPTAVWLIYGHNMRDGSMFGGLTRYRDADFCAENPTFTFDTLYETGTWRVVAALDTTLGADALPYYTFFDAEDEAEWQRRVDAILDLALYDTGVTPAYGEQLLILSTCGSYETGTSARFALLAVREGA